jgi:alpha-tubulin suppressor-like RCC1 family protein
MISAGFYHNLALDSAGKLYAWGMNSYGQLGTGNTTNSPTPVSVASSMYSISKIAAAGYHSLAIARSSSSSSTNYMYSWGLNSTGQLCLGTTTNTTSPTLVSSLSSVKDVAGGYEASIALVGSSLYTCGGNSAGELGIGTLGGYKSTPQKLPFSVFKSPKSGGLSFYAYDTSLTSAMWGWGWNDSCQLGYNTYGYDVLSPVFASPYFPTTSTGWAHVLYIDSYGQVYAVGENDRGEIGNGQVGADVCYPTRVLLP